jgi:hypothetical protein
MSGLAILTHFPQLETQISLKEGMSDSESASMHDREKPLL